MADVLRVAQLSDTHFLERGIEPEGGHGYDTSDAFDAVLDDLLGRELDLVVVTGDIADHGRAEQYEIAAAAFARLPCPVSHVRGTTTSTRRSVQRSGRPACSCPE